MKLLNFNSNDVSNKRLLQLNALKEFRVHAYEHAKIYEK